MQNNLIIVIACKLSSYKIFLSFEFMGQKMFSITLFTKTLSLIHVVTDAINLITVLFIGCIRRNID